MSLTHTLGNAQRFSFTRARGINPEGVVGVGVAAGSVPASGGRVGVFSLSVRTLRGCAAFQLFKKRKHPRGKISPAMQMHGRNHRVMPEGEKKSDSYQMAPIFIGFIIFLFFSERRSVAIKSI